MEPSIRTVLLRGMKENVFCHLKKMPLALARAFGYWQTIFRYFKYLLHT